MVFQNVKYPKNVFSWPLFRIWRLAWWKKIIHNFDKVKEDASNILYSWEHEKKLRWIYETSDDVFKKRYIPNDLDFIYIDANHNYEFVKRDIENSWNLLKKGGVLIGHDFTFYSVAKAVIEFAEKKKLKVITKAKDWEWIIIKEWLKKIKKSP
mgnify:CR=1 FL=1